MSSAAPAVVRGRYAPSPSGDLHMGNLRTALLAWLQARLQGGEFILRMEDLDRPRTRPDSAERIIDDLTWLGLDWDAGPDQPGGEVFVQSRRDDYYREAFDTLRVAGRLFECYCSRKDIRNALSAPHGKAGIVYPGTCRERSVTTEALPAARKATSWRYRAGAGRIQFQDQVLGSMSRDIDGEIGDFVIRRADGLYAYQLAVMVDDALMGITDVVRGADLLESTPRQLLLYRALGYPEPRFWHVPLMLDADGKRMAKRDGSDALSDCRRRGERPEAVVGRLAASVGLLDPGQAVSARELLQEMTIQDFQRAMIEHSTS